MSKENEDKKEIAIDVVKGVLQWFVVSALSFLYWMAMLLIFSLILMNIWHTSFEEILRYGTILTIITAVVYAVMLIRRKKNSRDSR